MNLQTRRFKKVDVFTAKPYLGNPLAVVLDGAGLSTETMQRFACWTNLSETTFVLPPSDGAAKAGADYQVRIFTPGKELPFAGHPTLGTCHAWLEQGGKPRKPGVIVQECAAGLIELRQTGQRLAFAAPPLKRTNPSPSLLAQVATALGLKVQQIIAAQHLDNGPQWLGLLLDSQQTVLQVKPDHHLLKGLIGAVGIASVQPPADASPLISRSNREAKAFGQRVATNDLADSEVEPTVDVRCFAPGIGVGEDPVTGSFNASLAQWLITDGYAPSSYVASQGVCLGHAGLVYINQDDKGQVWVGGDSVTCIDGTATL